MQQIKLLQVDATTLNALPPIYGIPTYFMVGGNGQIKLWPQPSAEAISAGLRITFDLTSSDPSALSATA